MVTVGLTLEPMESRMSPKPEAARLFLPRDPSENMTLQVSLSLWKQRHFSGLSYEVLAGVTLAICPILPVCICYYKNTQLLLPQHLHRFRPLGLLALPRVHPNPVRCLQGQPGHGYSVMGGHQVFFSIAVIDR